MSEFTNDNLYKMDLIERFRYIMKLNNLTASVFADEIGVQRSSVSHILSGRNKPSLEFIQKVISKYPKVDATWLISGKMKMDPIAMDSSLKVKEKEQLVQPEAKKEDLVSKKRNDHIKNEVEENKTVERVLLFYTDGTFKEYTNK